MFGKAVLLFVELYSYILVSQSQGLWFLFTSFKWLFIKSLLTKVGARESIQELMAFEVFLFDNDHNKG